MKKKLAITLDEEIVELLQQLSEKESRSISGQINKILMDYFKELEKPVD